MGGDEAGGERDEREDDGRGRQARAGRGLAAEEEAWAPRPADDGDAQADRAADSVMTATCRSTITRTRDGAAPSAMRRPISRVRCVTV